MGKSTQTKTNDLLDQQRKQQTESNQPVIDTARSRGSSSYDNSQKRIGGLSDRYTDYADTGGFSPSDFDTYRSSFGGGGGGSSVASELSGTGGIDESKFNDALAGYKDFASSGGGVDAEGIRYRSNRVIPSFYKNLQNEQERRKLVNPYSPSFDAESAAMARQSGQQTQENIRDTETGISEMVSKGRQFGIAGLGNLNTNIQGMIQQGKIAGGNQQIANAGLSESAAARRQSGEESILNMKQKGKLAGLGGLQGLYDTENSNAGNYFDRYGNAVQSTNSSNLNAINSRQNTTPWWQTAVNAAAGAAGTYFSGGLNQIGPRKKPGSSAPMGQN